MKMTDSEFNKFNEVTNTAYGIQAMLEVIEERPSKIDDEKLTAIATLLKNAMIPVVNFLQHEVTRHEGS